MSGGTHYAGQESRPHGAGQDFGPLGSTAGVTGVTREEHPVRVSALIGETDTRNPIGEEWVAIATITPAEGKIVLDFAYPVTKFNGVLIQTSCDFRAGNEIEPPENKPEDDRPSQVLYCALDGVPGLEYAQITGLRQLTLRFGVVYTAYRPFANQVKGHLTGRLKDYFTAQRLSHRRSITILGLDPEPKPHDRAPNPGFPSIDA